MFIIAAFYKFASLPHYETMKEPLLVLMREKEIKGTLILACEGINGTFAGLASSVECLVEALKSYPELNELRFHLTFDEINPFKKAKVKLRKEIVTLGHHTVNPNDISGKHLTPQEWNQLITDPDVVLVDTRNDYEVELGTFKGAINPKTENFRDFPEFVQTQLLDKKNQKIAMFCTGGIRCEKSTSYLKQLGFNEVYQLHGGILNYLETIPQKESQWQGECFVFDERVALDHNLKSLPAGSIDKEWKNNFKEKADR